MNRLLYWLNIIVKKRRELRRWKRIVTVLAAVITFATTYALILPAITVEKDRSGDVAGMYLEQSADELKEENALEPAGVSVDAESENEAASEDGTALTDAEIPEYDDSQEENDVNSLAEADDQLSAALALKTLKYYGSDYTVNLSYDESSGIPDRAILSVSEIAGDSEEYQTYLKETKKAMGLTEEETLPQYAARFFDIKIMVDDREFTPETGVSVEITYAEPLAEDPDTAVSAVHFADESAEAEMLEANTAEVKDDGQATVEFTAESFSVYGVIYTVDFEFEFNGKAYTFSMNGEDAVSLRSLLNTLHAYEIFAADEEETSDENSSLDKMMSDIDNVIFSNPEVMAIVHVDKETTLGNIKVENDISQSFASWQDQGTVIERNAKEFQRGDWALISLEPFSTEETLKIIFKTGEYFIIKVTDAQDANMQKDGIHVDTISNPAGTKIDLFNYWVKDDLKDAVGREAWPGYEDGWYYHDENEYEWYKNGTLLGEGNDAGINAGHMFKFNPAWAGTVYEGTIPNKETSGLYSPTRNPTNVSYANDGDRLYYVGGLNSYTGSADPRQGLVTGTLVGGYPKLTENESLGTDGESLDYLFTPSNGSYRDYYEGVDKLLYVDNEGYYTYNSGDYKAELQEDNTFSLTEQTSTDTEVRGFWPFGQQKFWVGMHLNAQFSMPTNGQVLNPREEYKDMQFEFSGDDDTWLYVDGVLVGDGGGIHNRTEIDINFAAGTVTVTGKKDSDHTGSFEKTDYLDDIFKAAGRFHDDEWEDIGDGSGHMRFKAGTYHTFDMFYLERGGGESNLYIHYNLVSTADFTGHKSYEGFTEDERMSRDQFKFELIGLDGQYQSVYDSATQTSTVTKLNDDGHAIMPTLGTEGGEGTVADPRKEYSEEAWGNEQDGYLSGYVFTTGVTEDGNINFGTAEINETEIGNCNEGHPSLYRYIIREIVPDDAVNSDGIRWDAATDEQKAAGGFVKDQIRYDETIYYMTACVTSWPQTGTDGNTYMAYGLSKAYYTDDTFTQLRDDVNFVDFRNRYAPDKGKAEFVKVDGIDVPLPGAQFTLYMDQACTKKAKDLDGTEQVITSGADGKVVFENMAAPRTYYMKETAAPEGYKLQNTVYKVMIVSEKDPDSSSLIIVNGDESQTPVTKISNSRYTEEGLEVYKYWKGGAPSDDTEIQYKLYQTSSRSKVGTYSVDVTELGYGKPDWNAGVFFTNEELTGKKAAIKKGSIIEISITTTSGGWSFDTLNETTPITSNQTIISDVLSDMPDGNKQRVIRIQVTNEADNSIRLTGQLESCYDSNGGRPTISSALIYEPDDSEAGETKLVGTVTLGKETASVVLQDDFVNSDPMITVENGRQDWTSIVKNLPEQKEENGWIISYTYQVEEVEASIPLGYVLEKIVPASAVPGESIGIVNKKDTPETVNVIIKKTDNINNSTNFLADAVFELTYRCDASEGWRKAKTVQEMSVPELDENSRFTVPIEGISLTGLINGEYRLEEISPPAGYVITNNYPVVFTISDGSITGTDGTIDKVRYEAATDVEDAVFIIPNEPGAALPSTGGPGTNMLYLLGITLIGLAGVGFVMKRIRTEAM